MQGVEVCNTTSGKVRVVISIVTCSTSSRRKTATRTSVQTSGILFLLHSGSPLGLRRIYRLEKQTLITGTQFMVCFMAFSSFQYIF